MTRITSVVAVGVVALALVGGLIPPAGAQTGFFRNNDGISTPVFGDASPYPSSIAVSAACDVITDVDVLFDEVTHGVPDDLDLFLVGPSGQNAIIMSDAGGGGSLSGTDFTLDDEAAGPLQDSGQINDGTSYQPANYEVGGDTWGAPAPTPSGGSALSVFDGTNPTGTWRLFVTDDVGADAGTFDGWSLRITSTPASEICIPGGASDSGPAAPYPDTETISGLQGLISDVNLTLTGVTHTTLEDVDILLVGPSGQNAFVVGGAGGDLPQVNVTFTLDDEAPGPVPDTTPITPGSSYQPANHPEEDSFDPPAPTPTGSAMSVFDGTNPNGTWSLFVDDDAGGDVGRINDWSLQITAPGPSVSLSGGKAKEGKPIPFQVTLSGAPALPLSVPFATLNGSAKARKDFKTASGNLTFATGETAKTVVVKTKDDRRDEKNKEQFSLQLTTATANVLATAKIKDNDK